MNTQELIKQIDTYEKQKCSGCHSDIISKTKLKQRLSDCEEELKFLKELTMPLINNSLDSKINQRFIEEYTDRINFLKEEIGSIKLVGGME